MGVRDGGKKMTNRRGFKLIASLAVVAALGLTACSGDDSGSNAGPATDTGVAPAAAATPPTVTTQPANGATDASPGTANGIKAAVENGTIKDIRLTNPDGKEVTGDFAADKKTWTVNQDLGFGKTYTWSGTAVGTNGQETPINGSFTTVKPKRTQSVKINVDDHKTYGIAMPTKVYFTNAAGDEVAIKDKASVEKALKIEALPQTEGAWAWLSDGAVHWRPKEYWKPNTQVKVHADLSGVSFGDGVYGSNDISVSFSIGREQTVEANTQTHRLIVRQNGRELHNFPASYGLDSDKRRVTPSGPHVVMSKQEQYTMRNDTFNYTADVTWAVRISNNGEFIHAYDKTRAQQGNTNVSHGCANLTTENARTYFQGAMVGDPVIVTGSSVQMSDTSKDYFDWAVTWDKWLTKSALR